MMFIGEGDVGESDVGVKMMLKRGDAEVRARDYSVAVVVRQLAD